MRGKGELDAYRNSWERITPAYAGKRAAFSGSDSDSWDHPRVCGEKSRWNSDQQAQRGSPPRMRGKDRPVSHRQLTAGITPAYAGKRVKAFASKISHQDHPRVCGEKACGRASPRGAKGSPPRMRGKVWTADPAEIKERITPAYAGKSGLDAAQRLLNQDHPRVCGEKCAGALKNSLSTGSPPRMRGKARTTTHDFWRDGITPAYAGKRQPKARAAQTTKDHPRVCGEKQGRAQYGKNEAGSPPRMRGKGLQPVPRRACTGITPAYAGKRGALRGDGLHTKDHPRVCGEKVE